jgi:hypothetical protein
MMTAKADTCGNIQDFSEYVEEIRDIFKRMVILLKICLLRYFVQCFLEHKLPELKHQVILIDIHHFK